MAKPLHCAPLAPGDRRGTDSALSPATALTWPIPRRESVNTTGTLCSWAQRSTSASVLTGSILALGLGFTSGATMRHLLRCITFAAYLHPFAGRRGKVEQEEGVGAIS